MNFANTLRRPPAVAALAVFVLLLAALAAWFKPWGLIINQTVSEAAPPSVTAAPRAAVATPARTPATTPATTPAATPAAGSSLGPDGAGLERAGKFVPGEHEISGTALFILSTQGVVLRLEDLRTTNGPDVRVYLSTLDNGEIGAGDLQIAPIKGNRGNQNYLLPVGTDVSKYRSVVIWCERFSVGFGHAVLSA